MMFKGFWRLQKKNDYLRTKKGSPNTYSTSEEWEKHNPTEPGGPPFLQSKYLDFLKNQTNTTTKGE
jgi:hypothetical protein